MRCISPLKLKNPKYGSSSDEPYYIEVGCNKCYACRTNRRREWFLRLSYEYDNSNYTYFVTLTYDNHNIDDGFLHKEHLQKWLKAIKRKYDCSRYYAIGEYGTHTFRPHYHAIIFSDQPIEQPLWPYGFTLFEPCTSSAQINYILHYHTRPKVPDFFDDNHKPAFSLQSKGLGSGLMSSQLVEYLINHKSCTLKYRGETYVFPRYYQKKFGISAANSELSSSRARFNEQYQRKFNDSEYSRMKLREKSISDKHKRKVNNQIKNV